MSDTKRIAKTKAVTLALATGAYLPLAKIEDESTAAVAKLIRKGSAFNPGGGSMADNDTKQALSLMLGVDAEHLGKRSLLNFDPFVAMVPEEDNGDLKEGRVYVLLDSRQNDYFTCSDGSIMGARMSTSRKRVRPASPEEIDAFYAELDLFTI